MIRAIWALINQHKRCLYLVDENCNFIEPVKRYLDYLAALEKSPHTLENYCRHLHKYFLFLQTTSLDWRSVTPDNLVDFVQWLRTPTTAKTQSQLAIVQTDMPPILSRSSVNTILTAVMSFYRYHIQRGEVLTNPIVSDQISNRFSHFKPFLVHTHRGKLTTRGPKLREPRKHVQALSDSDLTRFMASVGDNLQFRCMVLLMRDGGLRIGEVLGLLIQDIAFHENGIWVQRREGLDNAALAKGLVAGETRFIDLDPHIMALLDALILTHTFATDHVFVVLKLTAHDKRGCPTYGQPLNRDAAKALFRYYTQKSGVAVHAHMLRHAHATELIKAGWDASYVQKRLGHAQVQTTINTYVHLDRADLSQRWREYQEKKNYAYPTKANPT